LVVWQTPTAEEAPVHSAEVKQSLEPIAQMLASDGYELVVEVQDGLIELAVEATADACVDCLVPQATMEQIIRARLAESDPAAANSPLRLRYPAGSGAH
jgi:hypothetical protein